MAGLLYLHVLPVEAGVDRDEIAVEAQRLRDEFAELDLQDVTSDLGSAVPAGAKAGDAISLGLLVLKLSLSQQLLRQLVDLIRDWASRSQARRVRLEIDGDHLEIDAVTKAELQPLIDSWVEGSALTSVDGRGV